jgi:hypothetical protein
MPSPPDHRACTTHGSRRKPAGHDYVNIDGILIETDRCRTPGPTEGVDLWCPESTTTMAATSRSSPCPPARGWTPYVRPSREHDTTVARTHTEILPTLTAAGSDLRTLGDRGYEGESGNITVAFKKPKNGKLNLVQQ